MHIAIIDPEVDISLIETYIAKKHTLYAYEAKHDEKNIDALIIRSLVTVDKDLLERYPHITHIFRVGVGLEKVDTQLCKQKNINVINTPGANSSAVAELAIWALLDGQRKPLQSFTDLQQGISQPRTAYIGHELSEITIGYLGFGNVGKEIAKRVASRNTSGYYYDPYVEGTHVGIQKTEDQTEIFRQCNVIIIVAPLVSNTKHTINTETLALCKDDVHIINMSRGGLVDEQALYHFLSKHSQASFFSDVWESEPAVNNSLQQLLTLPNVIITHHIGAATSSALERMHYFSELAS